MRFSVRLRVCAVLLLVAMSTGQKAITLRDAADQAHILIGAAARPSLFSEMAYSATLAREFNMIEPEDAMKWWVVRRDRTFDFRDGDAVVQFARAHAMKVRGHCLVWDHDNPAWLTQANFTPAQLSELLHEHITTMVKHYAGQVFAWDVVNEALDENGSLKNSIWYNRPGIAVRDRGPHEIPPATADSATDYIEQAFRWAHEADPQALLFYNEAEAEGLGRKSDAVYVMAQNFKVRGVPIDGVGLQMHISDPQFDVDAVDANIDRLTKLGLQVHITELDVSLPVDSGGHAEDTDLLKQAEIYRRVVHACLKHAGCTAIQTWGFTDKWSWIGSHSHGARGAALLFDRSYKPKPAYEDLLDELKSAGVGRSALNPRST